MNVFVPIFKPVKYWAVIIFQVGNPAADGDGEAIAADVQVMTLLFHNFVFMMVGVHSTRRGRWMKQR